jgi:NitT/TauT family transport system substrate-binding protein
MKQVIFAAALSFAAITSGAFTPADAKTITIMVGGMEKQIYLPAMLTEKLGYFKDQGLDVELSNEPAGIEGADALLAGEVQGVVGFYDHTIDLQGKGKYAESVVQFSRVPGEVELVSAKLADKVHSFADLKGMSLGVTGLGSSTNFLTLYMAQRAGLKPGDITTVAVGAGNTFLAAMKQDQIQGGMTTEPTISRAVSTGLAKVLVDMRTAEGAKAALGGTYPAACLYMSEAYVKANPQITQKLANAFVKTMQFIASHSAEEIADKLPKDYYAGDKASYVKALDAGKAMFTSDGRMPADGPETVLKVLTSFEKDLQHKQIDLSRTYTTSYVDKAGAPQ